MEPATPESASNQLSDVRKYAGGFSRQQRRELQNEFEAGLHWLEQQPPEYDRALRVFAKCMQADPMGAVYTFEFLQTLEQGYEQGLYKHGWRQRRRNSKQVKRIVELCEAQQWHDALQQAPDTLYHNARNQTLLLELAFAAQALDAIDTQWTYLEFALKYFPSSSDVHIQIVHAYYQAGRYDDANDHIFRLVSEKDDVLLQQILRALPGMITVQFPAHEDVQQILDLREQVLQEDSPPEKWQELCRNLEDLNLYGQAIEACSLAQQATGRANYWSERTLALRLEQAESRLSFHCELQSDAALLEDLQHEVWRIRTEYYQQQTTNFPNQIESQLQLGWCLVGTHNWYEAIKQFNSITLAPENPSVFSICKLLGLGESQQAIRRFDDAWKTYQELQNLLNECETTATIDQQAAELIPWFSEHSTCERAQKRVQTLAKAMKPPTE